MPHESRKVLEILPERVDVVNVAIDRDDVLDTDGPVGRGAGATLLTVLRRPYGRADAEARQAEAECQSLATRCA